MLIYLSAIWKSRYFWLSLVRMDLRTRYRRSLLGMGWSLLQPLAMTGILFLVFKPLLNIDPTSYVPHLLSGLVCWNFIVFCGSQGCQCFFQGESYIRQYPLPLAIYPLRTSIGALFHLAMGFVVLIGVCAVANGLPGPIALLSLVPTLALLFVFGWSLAVLFGSANVYFQDTQHLTDVFFQILFYMTPIIYPIEKLAGHRLGWLLQGNPVVAFLTLVREPLLQGSPPTPQQYLYALGIALALAACAAGLIGRLQKRLIFHL
jgi:ABC-type polysaccharide/polyol phosphate export permease